MGNIVTLAVTLSFVLGSSVIGIASSVPVPRLMADPGEASDTKCPDQTFDHFMGSTSCRPICPPYKTTDANIQFCNSNCPELYSCLLETIPFRVTNGSADAADELPVTCRHGFFYHVLFRSFFNCTQICRNDTTFCRKNCPDFAVCAFGANGSSGIASRKDTDQLMTSTTESTTTARTMTDTSLPVSSASGSLNLSSPAAVRNGKEMSILVVVLCVVLLVFFIILIVVVICVCGRRPIDWLVTKVFGCPQRQPHNLPAAVAPNADPENNEVDPLNVAEQPPEEAVEQEVDEHNDDEPLNNAQPRNLAAAPNVDQENIEVQPLNGVEQPSEEDEVDEPNEDAPLIMTLNNAQPRIIPVEHADELSSDPDDAGSSVNAIQESRLHADTMSSSELLPGQTWTGQPLTQPSTDNGFEGNPETFRKASQYSDNDDDGFS